MGAICLIEGIIALIVGTLIITEISVQTVQVIGAIVILFGVFCGIIAGLGILDGQRWALTLSGWSFFTWAKRPEVRAYFGTPAATSRAAKKSVSARFCPNCGAPASPSGGFCTKCGAKLK